MKRINKKSIFFLLIGLIGLLLSVYLVLNYQTILSRASATDYSSFTVKDSKGNLLSPHAEGVYDTPSLDVNLQINNLEQLSQ